MELKELQQPNLDIKNKETAIFIKQLYDDSSKMFLKQHRDWYINERYARGEHWIVYNKTLNKVQTIPVSDGEIRRTVNKIKAQMRGVKNFIKRNQPRWEVHPDDITDEAYEEAKKKNKIIQHIYRTRQFPLLLTDQIMNAMKFSLGIIEGGIIKKEGKDYLDFWIDDTFDVVFDPMASSIQNCRFIIKTSKKPVTYIKQKYGIKELSSDNKEAAASYKEMLENEKYTRGGARSSIDLETAIIYETYLKWIENDKTRVRIITSIDKQVLKSWDPSYKRFPMFGYTPERSPNSIYNDAWIKDLISLNKSLDKMISQVESYTQRMLAGKYLIKQGVEVSSITDKGAEKIYYKGSTPPVQQQLQPMPAAPFTYINILERFIEELGGVREASLGRIPSSLQSGRAIEALQSADAGTVAEPIENLEMMLEEVGEFVLEVLSEYQIASEEIIEGNEKIKFIGNVPSAPEGVMKINPSQVKVVIVPEIAYTEEAKKETLMQLATAGFVDPQTVLEKLSISNVGDIIQRMQKLKDEEFKQEMMKQKESHRTEGQGPEDTADLADNENMQMAAGTSVPMTPQALWSPEHTELHMAFIQQNQDAYNQHQDLFDEHIQAEQEYSK
jgi:hypothetical protein